MASRVLSRRHFFRDLPPAILLIGCAVVGIGILAVLFPYWSPLPRGSTTAPHLKVSKPQLNEFGFDKRYAGEIITSSSDDENCHQLIFDNRNGDMWDKGYVNCDGELLQFLHKDRPKNSEAFRLREVGKAFRHEGH